MTSIQIITRYCRQLTDF